MQTQKAKLDTCSEQVAKDLKISSITEPNAPITIAYIIEVMRDLPDYEFFAHIAAAMALTQVSPLVVGVNADGPEHHTFAINHFDKQMQILNFLYERMGQPNISLHAGELNLTLQRRPISLITSQIPLLSEKQNALGMVLH